MESVPGPLLAFGPTQERKQAKLVQQIYYVPFSSATSSHKETGSKENSGNRRRERRGKRMRLYEQ